MEGEQKMLRMSGLASGIDTDSIIKQLMQAHRIPQTKLIQKKQVMEWQRDDYRALNTKMLEFRNMMFDLTMSTAYNSKAVMSTDESAIRATAEGSAMEGVYQLEVEKLAQNARLTSNQLGASDRTRTLASLLEEDAPQLETEQLTIHGLKGEVTIAVKGTDTIADLVNRINSHTSETGVNVSYDETMDRLFFASTTTGEEAEVNLSSTNDQTLLRDILKLDTFVQKGEDAQIKFNDIPGSYASNNFVINGISIQALQTTDGPVNITVNQDTDAVFERIQTFVDKYNELIDEINGELAAKKNREFPPLTAEQKEDMTEKEIELWEEKARSGLLRGDMTLSSAVDSFRLALSSPVEGLPGGAAKLLSEIGISTDDWREKGKLHIDEAKLRQAIQERPDEVNALFRANDGDKDSQAGDGFAVRLHQLADNAIKSLTEKAGRAESTDATNHLGRQITDVDEQINAMNRKLAELEARYYRQFTAMEKYINQMNSQSMWLAEQFGY